MGMVSSLGQSRHYAVTKPLEDQLRTSLIKAKLNATEAANAATMTAIDEVIGELDLAKPEGMGLFVDRKV
jgi:uncharacterized protein (DUF2252 family)